MLDFERILAPNPGTMTLEGTNTYVVGRDPAYVIDPGPADAGHVEAVRATAEARGGIGAVLLTHAHGDHADAVEMLGVEPTRLADGESAGPLTALATPGHAVDHMVYLAQAGPGREGEEPAFDEGFAGDLIAGMGSTIVPPRENGGSLADYMASLRRVAELDLRVLHPGHGPDIEDPAAKIAEYIAHRQQREDRLVAALESGERSRTALLDQVWDDVPAQLRGAATVAMLAHLEKLEDEDRLPADLRD
jgi:glyoxylase-like metal-dependent hydrolase (beta-lactamase superfamily II)